MAEYITKEQIKYHRERVLNRWSGSRHTDCDVTYRDIVTKEDIDGLPTADVIEHSKIDKAIEELRKEIEENHLNVIDYADGEWIVKDFVYGAIERFKRNIGE